jgi:hypothetical protein
LNLLVPLKEPLFITDDEERKWLESWKSKNEKIFQQ